MSFRDELREEAQGALLDAADKIDALEKKLARLEDLRRAVDWWFAHWPGQEPKESP